MAFTVNVGTQFTVAVVVYNERSHYRRLRVRNVPVDSYVSAAFDSQEFSDQLRPDASQCKLEATFKCINDRLLLSIIHGQYAKNTGHDRRQVTHIRFFEVYMHICL